jgi:hypothetical protein
LLRHQFGVRKVINRRDQLPPGEIAGRAEDHHNARVGWTRLLLYFAWIDLTAGYAWHHE